MLFAVDRVGEAEGFVVQGRADQAQQVGEKAAQVLFVFFSVPEHVHVKAGAGLVQENPFAVDDADVRFPGRGIPS